MTRYLVARDHGAFLVIDTRGRGETSTGYVVASCSTDTLAHRVRKALEAQPERAARPSTRDEEAPHV